MAPPAPARRRFDLGLWAVAAAVVLAALSGALPFHGYTSTVEHVPSVVPEVPQAVERRPIMRTLWSSGGSLVALGALGLDPDLHVRVRRLDWDGTWWTPLWKSGTLRYALDAEVFGGPAKGGLELHYEGELRATFRGLCSPALAREALEERLHEYLEAEVREQVGSR